MSIFTILWYERIHLELARGADRTYASHKGHHMAKLVLYATTLVL